MTPRDAITLYRSRRIVVLREYNGRSRHVEIDTSFGLAKAVRVPIVTPSGFGAIDYRWNGRETTVAGYPVFERG